MLSSFAKPRVIEKESHDGKDAKIGGAGLPASRHPARQSPYAHVFLGCGLSGVSHLSDRRHGGVGHSRLGILFDAQPCASDCCAGQGGQPLDLVQARSSTLFATDKFPGTLERSLVAGAISFVCHE